MSCAPITHGPVLWEGDAFFFAVAGFFFGAIASEVAEEARAEKVPSAQKPE